jgi:hypothetical protein
MASEPRYVKAPCHSIPFGEDVSRDKRWVWCCYVGKKLFCMAATKTECKARYRRLSAPEWPWEKS